jgi:hypothetical protein
MVMEIFLFELLLFGVIIFIGHRARLSKERQDKMMQYWLNGVMRDAEQRRERVGRHHLKLVVNNKQRAND